MASDYQAVNISDLKNWGRTKKVSKKNIHDFELPQFLSLLRYEEDGKKYLLFESEIVSRNIKKIKVCKNWIKKYDFTLVERPDSEYLDLDYVDNGRGDEFIRQDIKQKLSEQKKAKIAEKELQALKKRIKGNYTLTGEASNHNPGDTVSFKSSICNLLSKKDKYSVKSDQSRYYLEVESPSKENAIKLEFELEFLPDGNLMLRKDNETILLQPID